MATVYMQKKAIAYANFVNKRRQDLDGYSERHYSYKERFLKEGRSILKALAYDMKLVEHKVWINKAGPAVSGDVLLMGLWHDLGKDPHGIYVNLGSPAFYIGHPYIQYVQGKEHNPNDSAFMYRSITHMEDYTGGMNQWAGFNSFKDLAALSLKLQRDVKHILPVL